ncbi:hypothetical protein OKA04_18510 [Luteolibacter flavescens]|uniref:Uncharacterized protein n=1 Tax=Luteolibacter flavescens TaxID=1859460 RepID=A0ABT3FT32_9BACT|nr:hypothetical protein [Luteolibacter flavescens]MCW1886738.1 hypothetical protein [Luteolibacter flavescens]
MKSIALLPLLSCLAFAAEPVKTTAGLPEDRIIFPQPDTAPELKVTATFKSDTVISTVQQGNWIRTEHLITYEITKPVPEYPHKELTFICRDQNPTPESGIMVKKVAWPFQKGEMTFSLAKDESVRKGSYFKIVRYDAVEPRK